MVESVDILALLSGPTGGVVGLGVGLGFAIGYNFAQRTTLKMALDQVNTWKTEADKWRDEYLRLKAE